MDFNLFEYLIVCIIVNFIILLTYIYKNKKYGYNEYNKKNYETDTLVLIFFYMLIPIILDKFL